MADGANSDDATEAEAPEPTGLTWACILQQVQRIEPDPEDDEPEDLFEVSFALTGPNTEVQAEVMVIEAADVEVVALALDELHRALLAWADLIKSRKDEIRAILSGA